ncbi:helix-turn-helix domain-containing protein, partial [archaeon]|nr:helix-turn-helix domain-containing protein [archaeon]
MKMPCEVIIWYILPGIRREITKSLLKNGLSQREVAKKLGITDAAVSQYLSE